MAYRNSKHTILLIQYHKSKESRTFMDFQSVNAAMDSVIKMYEMKLKELNPKVQNITYDIQNLYDYIDSLEDLSALVFDSTTSTYQPSGREWVKKKVFQVLKNQAA